MNLLRDEPKHVGGLGRFEKTIGVDDTVGFFSFNPCIEVIDPRCDQGFIGPSSFHEKVNGVCNCGDIDGETGICVNGVLTVDDVLYTCPFYSDPPVGYICYQEFKDSELEQKVCEQHWNANARTLQELFKLMYEWRDWGVDDNVAVVADALLADLDVPAEVETWIRDNVPDQAVARFLAGDSNARVRNPNVPDMSDEMSAWLWSKVVNTAMEYGLTGGAPRV